MRQAKPGQALNESKTEVKTLLWSDLPISIPSAKKRIGFNQRGATMIEYALIVAMISAGGVAAVKSVGEKIQTKIFEVEDAFAHGDVWP